MDEAGSNTETGSQPETADHRHWSRPGSQDNKRTYTEQDRLAALAIVAETGNGKLAARQTGIPPSTVAGWVRQAEEDQTLDRLRAAVRYRLGHAYVDTAERALQVLQQRLDTGDPHVLRDGRIIYRPILARDAVMIASICTDKHALITGGLSGSRHVDRSLAALADSLVSAMRMSRARAAAVDAVPGSAEQPDTAEQPGPLAVPGQAPDPEGGKARA